MSQPHDDDFFVGYLPIPARLRRFMLIAGGALLAGLLAFGVSLARATHGAGRAHFAFGQSQGLVGVLTTRPSAILWTLDPAIPGGVRGTLLVRQGKFGLGRKANELDGQSVEVNGYNIERDGHRMIELGAELMPATKVDPNERAQILARIRSQRGKVTITGEIVDSKCYLGRMRPGDARTHRACAQLCIAGGIPPLLIAHDDAGREQQYLLAARDGGPIFEAILPYVAEPVRVTGELVHEGDLAVLRTAIDQIERL